MSSFRRQIIIRRVLPGRWVNGEWFDGAEKSIPIQASIQPASSEDMRSLPEGKRKSGTYKLYTSFALRVAVEGQHSADLLTINGEEYEISSIAPWDNGVIPHCKALATRIEPDA